MDAVDLRGGFDLLRMLRLTQAAWKPTSRWHVGDLAWERRFHLGPSPEWPTRLWLDEENEARAWGWIAPPDLFELVVHPAEGYELALEVVDWAIGVWDDAKPLRTTLTLEQDELRAAFEERGFTRSPEPGYHYLACDPADVAGHETPEGFALRGLRATEADTVAKAGVHVAAWESKTMTTEVYRQMQGIWPYRHDLDVVAEIRTRVLEPARFAASCLAWFDDMNAVGELEPVGTDPSFRRRGLAAAVCAEAVRRLGEAGATRAIVYASSDPSRPGPLALYRSLGFDEVTRTIDLRLTRE